MTIKEKLTYARTRLQDALIAKNEKWMNMILKCITFLVGGCFIVEYTNWKFLIGLVVFLWGNNLMVADNYKEYFEKHSRKNP